MSNKSDEESTDRVQDEERFLKALNARSDIFSIEGNHSLRAICVLAIFFGACLGIGTKFLSFSPALPKILSNQNAHPSVVSGNTDEELDDARNFSLAENTRNLFSKTKKSLAKKDPLKRAPPTAVKNKIVPTHSAKIEVASQEAAEKTSFPKAVPVLESDHSLVEQGDQLKKHRDYHSAMATYQRALDQNPRNDKALAGMGDLYRFSGELDSAIQFYRSAIALNPKNPTVHNGLGTALFTRSKKVLTLNYAKTHHIEDPARYMDEQYDSAIAEYTEAITLDSSAVDALANRGVLRDFNNQHDSAIRDYSLAIRLKPANADAYSKRAATYRDLGKYDAAIADYSAAIRLRDTTYEFDPTLHFANAYFGRGMTYYKMGKPDQAISDFDSTLALSPQHALALVSKGIALADEARYDSAITAYTKALTLLTPKEYDGAKMLAYLQRGNSWKALGKYDSAIVDFQNAMASSSLAAKACWRIAECFCFKKDAANALVWLNKSKSFRGAESKKWRHDPELSLLRDMPEFKELTR